MLATGWQVGYIELPERWWEQGSFVMAAAFPENRQTVHGSGNALAGPGAAATINTHYHAAPVTQASATDIGAGRQRFAEMPVEEVPEPSGLLATSRRPFPHNRLFVGREKDTGAGPSLRVHKHPTLQIASTIWVPEINCMDPTTEGCCRDE